MATTVQTTRTCRNFINGRWMESNSGQVVERRNPANLDEVVSVNTFSTREETREAIAAAAAAFPAWRDKPAVARGEIVGRAAALMRAQQDDLAQLLTREEGKTLKSSLGEVTRAIRMLEFMAGESLRMGGDTIPSEHPKTFAYTVKHPLGVAAAITPWNFPVVIPCWKIAPALVAGNTVVLKPAELTSLTAARVVELFAEAGIPAGVLNMVAGAGEDVGDELVKNAGTRAISFTGSTAVGVQVYANSAKLMKKCQCEMGGKNPAVVLADANLSMATKSIVGAAFELTGQRCTATSRVIVEDSVADELVALIAARVRKWRVGDGMNSATDMGPLVDEVQLASVLQYIETGKKEARLVLGGQRLSGGTYDRGHFVAPTIFDHVPADSVIAQEEIFGPVVSVIRVADFDEAMRVANSVRYGLAAAIYTSDAAKSFAFVDRIEAGMVHVNSPTSANEVQLPFGGLKGAGNGLREQGRVAIDFFTDLKSVYIDYSGDTAGDNAGRKRGLNGK
jgi:alpha-ketoglutaric semialdehyde dehydrogenase